MAMGFADAIKGPLEWMWKEPAVLLAPIIGWLPGLLLFPALTPLFPYAKEALAKSSGDVFGYLKAHFSELIAVLLPLAAAILAVVILSVLANLFVSLALSEAARQKRSGGALSLGGAYSFAKGRWLRLLWACVVSFFVLLAAAIVLFIVGIAGVAAAAIPIIGWLIAAIAIIAVVLAFIVFGVAASAVFCFLPSVVAFTENTGLDAFKVSLFFARNFPGQVALLLVIFWAANAVIGQIVGAFFPILWLLVPASMVLNLVSSTWSGLTAASFWMEYGGSADAKQASSRSRR